MSGTKREKLFMGADLSLRKTGICVLNERARIIHMEEFPNSNCVGVERLDWLQKRFQGLLDEYKEIEAVAFEGYSFQSVSNSHSIGEWGGLAKLCAWKAGKQVLILPPTCLKKWATGKGRADKSAMVLSVFKHFSIDLSGRDNEADALWLAYAAVEELVQDHKGPKTTVLQKSGLQKVEYLDRYKPPRGRLN